MTWIEATCPDCGTIECSPEDFELALCDQPHASYYAFGCPVCGRDVRKPADARVAELLISEGVRAVRWEMPAEALEQHDGPALTIDDVLDFVLELERPDFFVRFAPPLAS
jgi:hypothetical protein